MPASVRCRVCHRPLRSLISVQQGVGPVCMRRVRAQIAAFLASGGEVSGNQHYAMTPEELQNLAEAQVQRDYREQRAANRQLPAPMTVDLESATRGTVDPVEVQFVNGRLNSAVTRSASGHTYQTTDQVCSCPDFTHRRSRNETLRAEGCRHIRAVRLARDQVRGIRQDRPVEPPQQTTATADVVTIHEENRRTLAQIDWTEDAAREQALNIWRENRAFDGTFMSRDEQAWNEMKREARQEREYQYENVLGGTGNTFGVELEVVFSSDYDKSRALVALYREGLISSPTQFRYHSSNFVPPGMWRAERDGSLGLNGLEVISPVLKDDPESWSKLEAVTKILREQGAKVTKKCGGHVHIGIAPLDHRTYSWQRLARIGRAYEHQFYKIGGANSDRYRNSRRLGSHRGTKYAKPLPTNAIDDTMTIQDVRRAIDGNDRRTIFNATNIDKGFRRNALEMRYPNGSIDHRQIQAQVQIANAVVHQAAVIRNDSPLSEFTPRLSEGSLQLPRSEYVESQVEENNFRRFLDVLGNKQDRLAATWLWLRGSV